MKVNVPGPTSELELVLTRISDEQPSESARIRCPGVLVAGRKPPSQLLLPASDLGAGRMHFLIELMPAFCRLTNHHDNGTFVNGMMCRDVPFDLWHGDLIKASKSVFQVALLRDGKPAALPPSPTIVPQHEEKTTLPSNPVAPPSTPPITLAHPPGYKLLHKLGEGAMGRVWLAEDREGRQVACKLIRPELALDPDSCVRFRREATHLRDLSHPHIVGFRDEGVHQGLLYLVMEYVPGDNLADLLKKQGLFEVRRAVRLTCQILAALEEAHKNGVVHRDVKPSNILVQETPAGEEVRLADFGLAKAYQSADPNQCLTMQGMQGGTLAFAAPEMLLDFGRATPLADQYGAAATLYNLLTGGFPHEASNPADMWEQIRHQDAIPLEKRRAGLHRELTIAVHRALSREPMQRFPTIQAMREALLPHASEHTG